MKTLLPILFVSASFCIASEEGFTPLMDGKTFDGWKKATENTETWKIEDGAFVAKGERCHLFYEGDGKPFTRKLAEGTFGLQAHDPGSVVHYKNIRGKRL